MCALVSTLVRIAVFAVVIGAAGAAGPAELPAPVAPHGAGTIEPPLPVADVVAGAGVLVVRTSGAATVDVDGTRLGATGGGHEYVLVTGLHQVRVEQPGHRAWQEPVRIHERALNVLRPKLDPLPPGFLVVRSNVSRDRVYIDGRHVGATGRKAHRLLPGRHQVRVEKRGYRTWQTTVEITSKKRRTVSARLRR